MPSRAALLTAVWLIMGIATTPADEEQERIDYRDAKRLTDAGIILSLEKIIDNYRRDYPAARILGAKLAHEHGQYVYELKMLGADGEVQEVEYDARTGEYLHTERPH